MFVFSMKELIDIRLNYGITVRRYEKSEIRFVIVDTRGISINVFNIDMCFKYGGYYQDIAKGYCNY